MSAFAVIAMAAHGLVGGCDGDGGDDGAGGGADDPFACTAEHNQWSQCAENMVQWCHFEDSDGHFHWGANCQDLGLGCVQLDESTAACVDEGSSCTPAEAKCEQQTAYNCLPSGKWAVEPCLSTACQLHEGQAECVQQCSSAASAEACDAMAETPHGSQVTETFADVFSEDYHAELNEPVEVTLPDNAASHIHFPVTSSGEFAVFISAAEVFDTILDKDEHDALASGSGANSECPSELPDQYLADLTYGGSGDPQPFVIRFQAVPTQTVTFVIKQKCK